MSEPDAEPSPSLIQQRHALGRSRIAALILVLGWGAFTVLRVVFLDVTDVLDWILTVGAIALTVCGVVLWFRYRRDVRKFEERYGHNAGRQT
ncbi:MULTISPECIES: hypothetical protein [unclassified Microbacterium]|uniref:hypothetical protein n=1 Tax=unclassified Microbacterium TaxID=2609290 RepID=UPI00109C5557|nr:MULTISPECIES: hypothetical protein [unclassified Microbacterium]